jgi:hypothetical protein
MIGIDPMERFAILLWTLTLIAAGIIVYAIMS